LGLGKHSPPRPEDHREDHQPKLVDEAVLQQPVNERPAPGHEDDSVDLFLEPRHFLGDVTPEECGVVPVHLVERARDHVLRHLVHLVREAGLVGSPGPRCGEALVGHSPQQERLRFERLVELVRVLACVAEVERPPAVGIAGLTAGGLHDAVEGNELRHDHTPHLFLLRLVASRTAADPQNHRA
jgi:hypothetical protein